MSHQDCIFCKIIAEEIPSKKIKETSDLIVLQDIAPKAPVHYLIIPKKHFAGISSASDLDQDLLGSCLLMAKEIGQELGKDFRIMVNNGSSVGQTVFHLHLHFLAGKKLSEDF